MSETSNGHLKWNDWFLDYGVFGNEGLCLVDGFFRGQKMFNKLSLPVIRVKYTKDESGLSALVGTGCGPYNDQITWDTEDFGENLNPISGPHHLVKMHCGGEERYICLQESTVGGVPRLRLGVYARIGAYHIFQAWSLDNGGTIRARVFSKGLSCNLDHWHHPYWRLDFALGSPQVHRLAVHRQSGGPAIANITSEGRIVNTDFGRFVEYRITSTQAPTVGSIRQPARAVVVPPSLNPSQGVVGPTPFSSLDGYARQFRPLEDRPWLHKPEQEIAFPVHDSLLDTDIVFWSVCHLFHQASEGEHHWHSVGPDIRFRPMTIANLPPETMRSVKVTGKISVKDFGVVDDEWKFDNFSETVLVNPGVPAGEVVRQVVVGDVRAELVIRVTWNPDSSVNVRFDARLFDELERVSHVGSQFNVLRDSVGDWSGIHLVDHHWGDPDTADMGFQVTNAQV